MTWKTVAAPSTLWNTCCIEVHLHGVTPKAQLAELSTHLLKWTLQMPGKEEDLLQEGSRTTQGS